MEKEGQRKRKGGKGTGRVVSLAGPSERKFVAKVTLELESFWSKFVIITV